MLTPAWVLRRIDSLSWATVAAVVVASAATVRSSSRAEDQRPLIASYVERTESVSVPARCSSWLRAARSPGWLETSCQPFHISESWAWMPVSLGSLKVSSSSTRAPRRPVRCADAPCSVCPRDSRKVSRSRCTSVTATPLPVPAYVECIAGTAGPPTACIATRWRV